MAHAALGGRVVKVWNSTYRGTGQRKTTRAHDVDRSMTPVVDQARVF